MLNVIVSGSFDDLHASQMRFLEAASRLGRVEALLWSDETVTQMTGRWPKFPLPERQYILQAIRYVDQVTVVDKGFEADSLPLLLAGGADMWVYPMAEDCYAKRHFCASNDLIFKPISEQDLAGFPHRRYDALQPPSHRKKVIVTGCFDYLHSGHVRFFEEVSELGDLYVIVGHDENLRLLKGEGHPLFPAEMRRYMVQSIRTVTCGLISSGDGWMDAAPEIDLLRPDMYVVNEDGDKPEKRAFCAEHGLEYVVLQRLPKEGLQSRSSTDLRGY
jgi:cytidyltransferase-like protein